MKIETGKYEVLETGSVIVPNGEFVEFEIENLHFRFNFIDEIDSSVGDSNKGVTATLVNEGVSQYLSIDVRNYNSLFTSPSKLLEVGTVEGKSLSVMFSVVVISGANRYQVRVFHYTWYKSKESCHGAE